MRTTFMDTVSSIVGTGLAQNALLLHLDGHISSVEKFPGGNASAE